MRSFNFSSNPSSSVSRQSIVEKLLLGAFLVGIVGATSVVSGCTGARGTSGAGGSGVNTQCATCERMCEVAGDTQGNADAVTQCKANCQEKCSN